MEELCDVMMKLLTKPYELHMIDFLIDAQNHFGMSREDFSPWENKVLLILSEDDTTFALLVRLDENTKYYINPTGRFVIGGPLGDTGLTGRKIIVDTYGGYSRHGGGAFSGKDPSKVDRSAAYMMRHIAKNIVANGYAKKCEIQVSYSIGMKEPLSICVNTYGTSQKSEEELVEIIKDKFDLTPDGMIHYLDLKKPIYSQTTNYGHFGKNNLPWEKIVEL